MWTTYQYKFVHSELIFCVIFTFLASFFLRLKHTTVDNSIEIYFVMYNTAYMLTKMYFIQSVLKAM